MSDEQKGRTPFGVLPFVAIHVATVVCVGVLGDPTNAFVADMVRVALWSNLWLIGINLLREGLDLPEVSLVAILDA